MTRLAQITQDYRDAGAMSDLIPLYGFVDDGVFLTKSGDLGVVLALDGRGLRVPRSRSSARP